MKALFVGLGGIGQRHARNLRAILGKDLELLAYRVRRLTDVVTPTLGIDRNKNLEREYDIRTFDNLDSALAQAPDVAFICNPSSMHIPVAMRCAEAGCDLFVEKPLSSSLDDVDRLIELVRAKRRIAMVAYQLRFHPCVQALRKVVEDGRLGRLLAVRAHVGEFLPYWHRYEDYRTMYAARKDLGGGVILSQIHEFDYLYSLFGTPVRLFAVGGHWSSLEIDVEDTASILLECAPNGKPLPVHVQLDYLQFPPSRQCEIVGEQGKAVLDLVANETRVVLKDKTEPEIFKIENFDRNQLFLDEMKHFLHCVATREEPLVTLRDGAQSLRMALAAKESIAAGKVVDLGGEAARRANP